MQDDVQSEEGDLATKGEEFEDSVEEMEDSWNKFK